MKLNMLKPIFYASLALTVSGCISAYRKSIGDVSSQSFQKVFTTDLNIAWQASLEALKNNQLDVSNKEAGYLQTKWIDNTAERNFVEHFGTPEQILKAKFRFRVSVAKGFLSGKSSVKVMVQKEQIIQNDVLEGMRPVETDGVEENTLLYRIGRVIQMKMKMAKFDDEKRVKAIEETKF